MNYDDLKYFIKTRTPLQWLAFFALIGIFAVQIIYGEWICLILSMIGFCIGFFWNDIKNFLFKLF